MGVRFSAVGAQRLCVLPGYEDENGTQDLQRGRFYAPTQVVLLFVQDAKCLQC